MAANVNWNFAPFERELKRLAIAGRRGLVDVVRQQGRLFVQDAARLTPPTGRNPQRESWAAQRQAGRSAVERDVRRAFLEVNELKIRNPKLKARLRGYTLERDFGKLSLVLRRMKITAPLAFRPTEQLHNSRRDRRGRVSSSKHRVIVLEKGSVARFAALKQKAVGLAKSGWTRAASALKAKLPGWVTAGGGPGVIEQRLSGPGPAIIVGDTVSYIQPSGSRLRVVQRALDVRAERMRNQAEAILKKAMRS